jgi:hypothetical protein
VIAAALLLAAAGVAAAEPGPAVPMASFSAGGVEFRVPVPDGYCERADRQAEVVRLMALSGHGTVVHVAFFHCASEAKGGQEPERDTVLIQTPKQAPVEPVERAKFLEEMGGSVENLAFAAFVSSPDALKGVHEPMARMAGTDVHFATSVRPLARDNVCLYVGGVSTFKTHDTDVRQSTAGCTTVVGGRVLTILRTRVETGPVALADHLRSARAVAETIEAVPAK